MTFITKLQQSILIALEALKVELPENLKIQVTASADLRFGDYQSNISMMLAKRIGKNPREFAAELVDALQVGDFSETEIAGPGFINFRLKQAAWSQKVTEMLGDDKLGVDQVENPRNIVIDFSAPNVAKPMHVGHIRSTIIGDTLARVSRLLGHNVITDNHIGDWGTQFGMVIYGWKNMLDKEALDANPLAELLRIYKAVNAECKADETIKDTCRDELVKLQQGDAVNLEIWKTCVDVSKLGLNKIYDRLDVKFDHWLGESYYNDQLAGLVDTLIETEMARESEGAICVFSGESLPPKKDPFKKNEDGEWKDHPMIVRKKDGGFNYATTDIATVDYRMKQWNADEILYVVDARQADHFRQLFDISERRGVKAKLEHVSFGTINGKDGKPLKTREGDLPQLEDILTDAVAAARSVIEEKNAGLPEDEKGTLAESIGVGSVKFTELSHHRTSDYKFDLEKMVALTGDTAPYLQNAHVRISAIFRKFDQEVDFNSLEINITEDAEINLSRMLSRFGEVLPTVLDGYKPNALAAYLLELARAFHSFFEACPVLKSEGVTQQTRLALCEVTSRVLKQGLTLLGIDAPERM